MNLKKLFAKLNATTRAALEGAAASCAARGHHHIEIEHYLLQLLQVKNSDLARIGRRFQLDLARLEMELRLSLGELETGNVGAPSLSPALVALLRDAWCIASLNFDATEIRSGYTLLALTEPPAELRKLNFAQMEEQFDDIVRKSVESLPPSLPPGLPPGPLELPE